VQNPGKQAEVAVVMRGDKGTGKGLIGRTMSEIFGAHGQHISNSKHLTGHFNGHLQDCSLLFVDEAFWAGDKQGEATLKQLITEPTKMIERKHHDAEKARNCLHIIMAANNDWVVPASRDERRYFVLDVDDSRRDDASYFSPLYAEISNGGREAVLYDLLRRDLSKFNIRKVPQTAALGEQKLLSLDPGLTWWHGRLASGELVGSHVTTGGLLSGTSTAPTPWGQVEKSQLQDDYEKAMRGQHASRKATETALHWLLRRVLPAGYPIARQVTLQQGGSQVPVYDFPPLQVCRDRFEEHLGLKGQIDWANGGCARAAVVARTQQIYVAGIVPSAGLSAGIRVGKAEQPRRVERVEPQRIVLADCYRSVRRG
jgi:hypothetical protein